MPSAQVTITQLPAAGPITGTESVPIVQNGKTVQTTTGAIAASPSQLQTFLTLNQEPTLPNSRALSGSTGITLVDGGALSTLQIVLNGASGSLEASNNGIIAKTGGTTVTGRTITASGAGLSVTNGNGVSGNPTIALSGLAQSIANLTGTGIVAINGGSSYTSVEITGTTNQIDVVNGIGPGNPTISISNNPTIPGDGAVTLPSGTVAQRPSGSVGQMRYNSETDQYEVFYQTGWEDLSSISPIITATNIAGGAAGSIPYQTAPNVTAMLPTASGVLVGGLTPSYSTAPTLQGTNFSSIPNAALQNSSITIGSTGITLGSVASTLAGLTSVTVTQPPSSALQLATKQYVDDAVSSGITIHSPVRVETPTALNATYTPGGTAVTVTDITGNKTLTFSSSPGLAVNDQIVFSSTANGIVSGTAYYVYSAPAANQVTLSLSYDGPELTSLTDGAGLTIAGTVNAGVGATLTNAGANAAIQIDGVSLSATNRVLVYNQANAFENGVYTVTTVGTPDPGGTPWVLTRATTEDTYKPDSTTGLGQGDYFFVQEGLTGAGESYVLTTANPIIIGTTNLTFTQFSASLAYSAGTGLTLTGTTFSLTSPVTTTLGGTGLSSYTTGDTLYYATGTALSKLSIGTATYLMTSSGTAPQWSDPATVTVGTATNATNVAVSASSVNATFYPAFVDSSTGNHAVEVDTDLTYNPSTNTLTAGTMVATTGIFGGTF